VALVAAAEAGVASASRVRLRAMASRGSRRAEVLHDYIQERASTLGALAVVRNLAVVLATALGIFLITRGTGHTWAVLVAVSAGALAAVALLDALPRLIVARNPEPWSVRLLPVIRLFRAIFGPFAAAINRSLAAWSPQRRRRASRGRHGELLRSPTSSTRASPSKKKSGR
jgi:Mg2+/Co2+ transporter CorB